MASCYVHLEPISWSQEIRRYPSINVEGTCLRLTCKTSGDSDLIMKDGRKLSDFELALHIFAGELDRSRDQLSEGAIGGISYIAEQSFVHGDFYLRAEDYAAVWDQVRDGTYAACGITLGVSPVRLGKSSKFIASDNPLSIKTAEINFAREAIAEKPANEEGFNRNKQWALVLFVVALTAWFFPQWNGFFF
jgi:hypothetical protein